MFKSEVKPKTNQAISTCAIEGVFERFEVFSSKRATVFYSHFSGTEGVSEKLEVIGGGNPFRHFRHAKVEHVPVRKRKNLK